MATLSAADRQRIVGAFLRLPWFETERGRRELLQLAGLESIAAQTDLQGSPAVVASNVVRTLETFGRLVYGAEALGVFLNVARAVDAPGEVIALFDDVLRRYRLMIPAVPLQPPEMWRARDDAFAEKIIGENTLRHIAFLELALLRARSVVFIETENWSGTGFLVAKDLVITSHHVVPDRAVLSKVSVRFNYQLTVDGREAAFERAAPATDGLFHADAATDHALFQLAGTPGDKWGFAPLSMQQPERNQRVNIIQHPAGMPKQISVQDNRVMFTDANVLQYVTATLNGSSGSPVFDDDWNVVAVHHAGGLLTEPNSRMRMFRNEGIAIPAVLRALPGEVQQKLPPVAGWNGR